MSVIKDNTDLRLQYANAHSEQTHGSVSCPLGAARSVWRQLWGDQSVTNGAFALWHHVHVLLNCGRCMLAALLALKMVTVKKRKENKNAKIHEDLQIF